MPSSKFISTHPPIIPPPDVYKICRLYVNTLYLAMYTFFFYEIPSTMSPGAKPSPSKPNWHRLPNWEPGLLGRVVERFFAPSCSPSGAKTSQMDVYNPYIPKYKISHPKFPPNVRNSEHNHPPTTSGIVYIYLPVSPTPTQQSRPITHPRPLIQYPRHSNHPTRSPKG